MILTEKTLEKAFDAICIKVYKFNLYCVLTILWHPAEIKHLKGFGRKIREVRKFLTAFGQNFVTSVSNLYKVFMVSYKKGGAGPVHQAWGVGIPMETGMLSAFNKHKEKKMNWGQPIAHRNDAATAND